MVTAAEVKALATRLAKAEALVAAGAVSPVAHLDNYFAVRNGDGTQMYLVRIDAGHEHCTCPDFTERQSKVGMPCKHLMAAQLAASAPQARPVEEPAATAPVAATGALALLRGDDDDFDPYPMQAA